MATNKEYSKVRKGANSKERPAAKKQSVFKRAPGGQKPAVRPAPLDSGGSGGNSLNDQ